MDVKQPENTLFYLVFVLFFCFQQVLVAQSTDSINTDCIKASKVKILPVPTIGYEPEAKTYIGVASLFTLDFYSDSLTRTSTADLEFTYTFRKQMIFETSWDYFFKDEKWFSSGKFHLSEYPDYYYGIGPETKAENELLYNSNRFMIDVGLYKNTGRKTFAGAGLQYLNYRNISSDSINFYPELKDASVFGIKAAVFTDTRNSLLSLTSGKYYFAEISYNFSSSNYWTTVLDFRRYFTLENKYIFSARWYNSFTFGTPAFYDYPVMGGDEFVRGYFYGRFRDKNLSTLQTELRIPVYKRIGVAAIGGLSSLFPDFSSAFKIIKPNYGLGIRYLIDKEEKINLRFDFVAGKNNQSGFYIGFGESF